MDPVLTMKYYNCRERREAHEAEAKKREDDDEIEIVYNLGLIENQSIGKMKVDESEIEYNPGLIDESEIKYNLGSMRNQTIGMIDDDESEIEYNPGHETNVADRRLCLEHCPHRPPYARCLGKCMLPYGHLQREGTEHLCVLCGYQWDLQIPAPVGGDEDQCILMESFVIEVVHYIWSSEHEKRRESKRSRSNRSNSTRAPWVPGEENKLRYDQKAYDELKRALDPDLEVANCDTHEKWVEALAECTTCSKIDDLLEAQGLSKQLSHSKKPKIGQLLEYIPKK